MTLFTRKFDFNLRKKTGKVLHLEYTFLWNWNLDTSERRSEIPGKFWNVVLGEDGDGKFDRSCEKWRSITQNQVLEKYPTYNKKKEG
jgi:hypothetical protein